VEFFELLGIIFQNPPRTIDYATFKIKLNELRDKFHARLTGLDASQVEKRKALDNFAALKIVNPTPEDKWDERGYCYLIKFVCRYGELKNLTRLDLLTKLHAKLTQE
jgi:hypothetical protein